MRGRSADLEARQVEQVLDEANEAGHLQRHRLEESSPIVIGQREIAVLQAVDGSGDRCQRRAEVVRDALEHSCLDRVRLSERVESLALDRNRFERSEGSVEAPPRNRIAAAEDCVGARHALVERSPLE